MTGTSPAPRIDLLDLLRQGTHFAETRGDFIHIVDSSTGRTLAVQPKNDLGATLTPRTLPDGTTVWSPEGHNLTYFQKPESIYSPLILDLICAEIVKGRGITEICAAGAPFPTYTTFSRWRRTHPEVMEQISQARLDRAENLRDQVLKHAEDLTSPKDVEVARLKVETKKWAASTDDPGRYSPKTRVDATLHVPTQIVVETGIRRERDVTPGDERKP